MALKESTGYKDMDGQPIYEGCKVSIIDGDMTHIGYVVQEDETFYVAPGFEGKGSREPLENHVDKDTFKGRVISYDNSSKSPL